MKHFTKQDKRAIVQGLNILLGRIKQEVHRARKFKHVRYLAEKERDAQYLEDLIEYIEK